MSSPSYKCYPYRNPWLGAAQTLSVLACILSWVWFVTFGISFLTMMLYQSLWFWRKKKKYLIFCAISAILAGTVSMYTGIYVHQNWETSSSCLPFFRVDTMFDTEATSKRCHKKAYTYISFACAIFWFAASNFMIAFVVTGGHSKLEANWSGETAVNDDGDSKDGKDDKNNNRNDNRWECNDIEEPDDKNNNDELYTTSTSTTGVSITEFEQALPLATINCSNTTLTEFEQALPLATITSPDTTLTEFEQALPLATITSHDDVPVATVISEVKSTRNIDRERANVNNYV